MSLFIINIEFKNDIFNFNLYLAFIVLFCITSYYLKNKIIHILNFAKIYLTSPIPTYSNFKRRHIADHAIFFLNLSFGMVFLSPTSLWFSLEFKD